MSDEELINKLCNKFVTGDNYDSRYTDDIYNSIIELDQYKNNWEELKGWIKSNDEHFAEALPFRETLRKMKELEENN